MYGMHLVVSIPRISLQPSRYLQVVGEMQDIICSVTITSTIDPKSVELTWTNVDGIITADNRVTIITNITENPSSFTYTTKITFAYLMERDEGNYTCNVETEDMMESRSIIIENFKSMQTCITSDRLMYMFLLFIHSTQTFCRGYQY